MIWFLTLHDIKNRFYWFVAHTFMPISKNVTDFLEISPVPWLYRFLKLFYEKMFVLCTVLCTQFIKRLYLKSPPPPMFKLIYLCSLA